MIGLIDIPGTGRIGRNTALFLDRMRYAKVQDRRTGGRTVF